MLARRFIRMVDRVARPVGREVLKRVELPLPEWYLRKPLADYDFAIERFHTWGLATVPGDILEIGAWLGFGTARLAAVAAQHGKVVHSADWFEVDFRRPETVTAVSVRRYRHLYAGMSQRQVFDQNTKQFSNIIVHEGPHAELRLPPTTALALTLIDGGHEYADGELYLTLSWRHTSPGGVIVMNDYLNPETPELTAATDDFAKANADQIADRMVFKPRRLIALKKR